MERGREYGIRCRDRVWIGGYAESEDADAIVMPTRSRTVLQKTILGSVTAKIIRMGSVPVLAVKIDLDEADRGP